MANGPKIPIITPALRALRLRGAVMDGLDLMLRLCGWGILALLPIGVGYGLRPQLTRAMLRDLRLPRVLHFVALGGLGMAIANRGQWEAVLADGWELAGSFGMLTLALTYAAVFAIVTNNVADLEADKISNPGRPLVRGEVPQRAYLFAGVACLVWALGIAYLHDMTRYFDMVDPQMDVRHFPVLSCITAISLGYYAYSCRPLRLKRIPVVAKLIIGFNSWVVALCGYALAGQDWLEFPWIWSLFILGPLALAANFVDLKDVAGDRATGIGTLPVLLGERWARHVIAVATLTTYGMGGILLGLWWAYPLNAAAALVHVYLLYRKPYDERWIFLVLVGSVLGLDFFLIWG